MFTPRDATVATYFFLPGPPRPPEFHAMGHRCQTAPSVYSAGVSASHKSLRRWFGALCLLGAIGLLIAGETVFKGKMSPLGFVIYWAGCFVLTALAAIAAVRDVARVRQEQRDEQRALIESTLHEIERESRTRQEADK